MFQEVDKHITRCSPFSQAELELFHSKLKPRKVRKRTFLLSEGEVCRFEAYIVKGCVKKYFIDNNGDEVILQFAVEDWWISDIASFAEQKPSNLFIETLEDSELLMIDFESKEQLYKEIPHLERVFRLMLQRSYAVLENRLYSTVANSAEERYLDFIKRYPTIPQRVPQQQIASYLGITPESLSRIKSNLIKKS
ncbi:Crp/Fnr family transcriptional regulator [Desertivirga brevis]|uniref:Crp/Fnr family transcriptional regulator n=1 Tax=Desertivirga brevis TaxID=2810310 RepID=UPI001A97AD67|nr:Crp/Fnr family transcriptional regulator [Pedobacter sp. SYSU D00873]